MSNSTRVFTLIPPGYEKLAAMMQAGAPIEKCLKKLAKLMQADELAVFHHHLALEDYFSSIKQLKLYLSLQQKINGTAPTLLEASVCPVYDRYQQLLYKIDTVVFTFIKDFYRWQPLSLALSVIEQHEQRYQQDLILIDDMPLAAYFKKVKQAFLHYQQVDSAQ